MDAKDLVSGTNGYACRYTSSLVRKASPTSKQREYVYVSKRIDAVKLGFGICM